MRSDPIADMLTRIRNASRAEHEKVDIPASRLKVRLAEIPQGRGVHQELPRAGGRSRARCACTSKYGVGNEKMISGSSGSRRRAGACTSSRDRIPSIWAGWGGLLSTSRAW